MICTMRRLTSHSIRKCLSRCKLLVCYCVPSHPKVQLSTALWMQNLGHPVRKDVQHMSNFLCGICIAGQLGIQAIVLIFLPCNYVALRKSLCTYGLLKCVRIVPVNFWLPEIHNFFNFSPDILMADCRGSFSSWEFSVCFWIFYLLAMPAQPLRKRHKEFKTRFRIWLAQNLS